MGSHAIGATNEQQKLYVIFSIFPWRFFLFWFCFIKFHLTFLRFTCVWHWLLVLLPLEIKSNKIKRTPKTKHRTK